VIEFYLFFLRRLQLRKDGFYLSQPAFGQIEFPFFQLDQAGRESLPRFIVDSVGRIIFKESPEPGLIIFLAQLKLLPIIIDP
jgi:hypothetical protein